MNKWISMKDEQPPLDVDVLVATNDHKIHVWSRTYLAHKHESEYFLWMSEDGFAQADDECVSHWMYLPMPPTGLSQEGPDR